MKSMLKVLCYSSDKAIKRDITTDEFHDKYFGTYHIKIVLSDGTLIKTVRKQSIFE